jgi:hypothetical protein
MSSALTFVVPPPGAHPSVLHLGGAGAFTPQQIGNPPTTQFLIPTQYVPAMLAAGWSVAPAQPVQPVP